MMPPAHVPGGVQSFERAPLERAPGAGLLGRPAGLRRALPLALLAGLRLALAPPACA